MHTFKKHSGQVRREKAHAGERRGILHTVLYLWTPHQVNRETKDIQALLKQRISEHKGALCRHDLVHPVAVHVNEQKHNMSSLHRELRQHLEVETTIYYLRDEKPSGSTHYRHCLRKA